VKFLIVTHTYHQLKNGRYAAYMPYVREMDLWNNYFDKITVVAPLEKNNEASLLQTYSKDIEFKRIPIFQINGLRHLPKAVISSVYVFFLLINEMRKADHIHIRCPGNIGLIGSFAQIFFPRKTKTAKYAGNWDWNSQQPWSYRLQQRMLRSTVLTHNMQVLVYGVWPDKNRNILPFFTASYKEEEIREVQKSDFKKGIKLCFIGTLDENKSPILSLKVMELLKSRGNKVSLTFCGEGPLRRKVEEESRRMQLEDSVHLLGNVPAEEVKRVLIDSHFLVFISKSEGWPKAVAESMFWGCVPMTSNVSCVPHMVGEEEERGVLLEQNPHEIALQVMKLVNSPCKYADISKNAMKWSRNFTLEKFATEIGRLIH